MIYRCGRAAMGGICRKRSGIRLRSALRKRRGISYRRAAPSAPAPHIFISANRRYIKMFLSACGQAIPRSGAPRRRCSVAISASGICAAETPRGACMSGGARIAAGNKGAGSDRLDVMRLTYQGNSIVLFVSNIFMDTFVQE